MDEYHTVSLQVGMSYLTRRLYSKCEPDQVTVFANGHLFAIGPQCLCDFMYL